MDFSLLWRSAVSAGVSSARPPILQKDTSTTERMQESEGEDGDNTEMSDVESRLSQIR